MQKPLINILIRTSNRPEYFARCLKSVIKQSYDNIRIIVGYDNTAALNYIPGALEKVYCEANRELPYFYDEYCNRLKSLVTDGWFLFLDDDDILCDDVLAKLDLTAKAIIVQLNRAGTISPVDTNFRRGRIGMPCLILHHSLKDLADVPGNGQGDYFWIKKVTEQTDYVFTPLVVVYSFGRGLGKV